MLTEIHVGKLIWHLNDLGGIYMANKKNFLLEIGIKCAVDTNNKNNYIITFISSPGRMSGELLSYPRRRRRRQRPRAQKL